MMRTPDGHSRPELSRFLTPPGGQGLLAEPVEAGAQADAPVRQARRSGLLAAQDRVRRPLRAGSPLGRRDLAHAARQARLLEDRLVRTPPTCSRRPRRRGRRRTAARAPEAARPRDGRRRSARVRWSATTDTSSRSAPRRSIVRTKLCDVQPKRPDVRTIHACSPAAASPWSFVRPYAESGLGASDSTYGSRFAPSKT